MARLDEQLVALGTMMPTMLDSAYQRAFHIAAPDIGPSLMRLNIAHHLQVRHYGDLDKPSRRELRQLASRLDAQGTLAPAPLATIKVGTRLVREWHGVTHQVLILDDAYLWQDQRYRSLSEIARLITGARWSGPRFFGLKGAGNG